LQSSWTVEMSSGPVIQTPPSGSPRTGKDLGAEIPAINGSRRTDLHHNLPALSVRLGNGGDADESP
jgi:hypothetical protein